MSNEQLFNEVSDLKTRTKLQSIQGYVSDLDAEILRAKEAARNNAAAALTAGTISKRVTQEMIVVQNQLDKDNLSADEAKIRISQIQRILAIVDDLEKGWKQDSVSLEGKAVGLEEAVKVGQRRFNAEHATWQRQTRMEAEAEQEHKDLYGESATESKPPKKTPKKAPPKMAKKPLKKKAKE